MLPGIERHDKPRPRRPLKLRPEEIQDRGLAMAPWAVNVHHEGARSVGRGPFPRSLLKPPRQALGEIFSSQSVGGGREIGEGRQRVARGRGRLLGFQMGAAASGEAVPAVQIVVGAHVVESSTKQMILEIRELAWPERPRQDVRPVVWVVDERQNEMLEAYLAVESGELGKLARPGQDRPADDFRRDGLVSTARRFIRFRTRRAA